LRRSGSNSDPADKKKSEYKEVSSENTHL